MRGFSRWIVMLCATPAGVVLLAALDSTLFVSLPFGIDAAVIILAARMRSFGWIVALLATAGSMAGAALTFWMGVRVGESGLERWVARRRLESVRRRVRNSGAIALAVLDLIPPPFPFTPFVLAAGALNVRARAFFVTLAVCRLLRFGLESALAVRYGSRILGWTESNLFHDIVSGCIVLAIVLTAMSTIELLRTSGRQAARRPSATAARRHRSRPARQA